MSQITLAQAEQVLVAALRAATELGVPSTVTVMDGGARVVAVARQDGAPLISVDSSAAKARTAAFFSTPTSALTDAVQPGAPLYTLAAASGEQLTFVGGGRPLVDAGGDVIGSVGSGGGTPEQDQAVVAAAAAALTTGPR